MKIDRFALRAAALAAASIAFAAAPLRATVLSNVQDHFAAGPVSLAAGQTASACAVNPDSDPIAVLIVLLAADNGNLIASRQATLQPGTGICVSYTRPAQQDFNVQPQNVYAVVVPDGRLDANLGAIVQDRPGTGGCIVASLQIQAPVFNNIPGQTIVYAQMIEHHHPGAQKGIAEEEE